MNILLVGPPGVGKGSQAELLKKHYNVIHISTGDMFRENFKNETELGKLAKSYADKGMLVPDEVTNKMVKERLSRSDLKNGFMLDGYPRNQKQAEALDSYLKLYGYKLDVVILLETSDDILIKRITGRRVCLGCKSVYHIDTKKPINGDKCDSCHTPLIQRADDTLETVKTRLDIYHNQASQLINFYDKKKIVLRIDGSKSIKAAFNDIVGALND